MAVCTPAPRQTDQPKLDRRSSGRLLAGVGEMTLCIRCRGHKDRMVRIRSPKCSIGSAAGCTLRLRAKGIGPLHCWVLRGTTTAIVRRLHGATTLNGRTFDETALRAGDRLQVGNVEVELVDLNQPTPETTPVALPQRPSVPASAELEARSAELEARSAELEAKSAELRGKSAELEEKLAAANERLIRLEEQARQGVQSSIVAAERADQLRDGLTGVHDQLEQSNGELAAAQETIAQQTAELADYKQRAEEAQRTHADAAEEREKARQAIAAAAKQQATLEAELTSARTSLEQTTEAWRTERAQLQHSLEQARHRLEQRDAELKAIRSTSTAQTGVMTVGLEAVQDSPQQPDPELTAKCADLEKQLGEKQAEIQAKQTEIDAKQAELVAKQADVAAKQADIDAKQTDIEAKRTEIEAKQAEIESLRQIAEGRAEIESRLNNLAQEYEQKCRELDEARAAAASNDQVHSQATAEHEERENALKRWQEELASREEKLSAEREKLADGMKAATAEKEQWSATRHHLETEQEKVASIRRELEADRRDLLAEKNRLAEEWKQIPADREEFAGKQGGGESLSGREAKLQQQADELEKQIAVANDRLRELEELREQLALERAAFEGQAARLQEREHGIAAREQELDQKLNELAACRDELEKASLSHQQDERAPSHHGEQVEAPGKAPPAAGFTANVTAKWQSPEDLAAGQEPDAVIHEEAPAVCQTMVFQQGGEEANNVDNVIGRLVRSGLWREDEAPPPEAEVAPPEPRSVDQAPPPGTDDVSPVSAPPAVDESPVAGPKRPTSSHSGDDESIESYMERLMQRVRGSSPVAQSGWKPATAALADSVPQTTPEATADGAPAASGEEKQASDYSPRRTAPELNDLSAMRELANTAARTAIDSHVRKRKGKQATGKLFGASATLVLSTVLGYWAWQLQSFDAGAGAGIGGVVGLYWCLSALGRLFGLRRAAKPVEATASTATPTK